MAIRLEPRAFVAAAAGAALYGGTTVGAAVVFGEVTDRIIVPAYEAGAVSSAALWAGAVAIIGVALFKAAGIVGRKLGAYTMQYRLHARFHRELTRRFTELPLSWHRRRPTGQLLAHADADVEAAFAPIAALPLTCGIFVMLVIAALALLATDVWLAVVALLAAPAIAALNTRFNARMRGPAARSQRRRADVSAVAHESFEGALVVKTLGREEAETDRFRAQAQALRDDLIEVGRIRATFNPLMEALPNATIVVLLLAGTVRLAAGAVSTGEIVLVSYLFSLLAFPLRAIGFILSELPRSVVGWERLRNVLEADDSQSYGTSELPPGDGGAAAALSSTWFAYGQPNENRGDPDWALRDIALSVEPGTTVAVVGPTGAGKSTLVSLLLRLFDPTSGVVALDGVDLRNLRAGALPGQAAIVFQDSFLFDDTVRENVTLGGDFSDDEVRTACTIARADGFIAALPDGYDTVIGERGASLSGGQRQRLALARALVRRPRLLILDDATSSVDAAVEQEILRRLRAADLPATVVLVAYRRATIALADEIVFVSGGRVVARGPHERLLQEIPGYRELVTAYDRRERAS